MRFVPILFGSAVFTLSSPALARPVFNTRADNVYNPNDINYRSQVIQKSMTNLEKRSMAATPALQPMEKLAKKDFLDFFLPEDPAVSPENTGLLPAESSASPLENNDFLLAGDTRTPEEKFSDDFKAVQDTLKMQSFGSIDSPSTIPPPAQHTDQIVSPPAQLVHGKETPTREGIKTPQETSTDHEPETPPPEDNTQPTPSSLEQKQNTNQLPQPPSPTSGNKPVCQPNGEANASCSPTLLNNHGPMNTPSEADQWIGSPSDTRAIWNRPINTTPQSLHQKQSNPSNPSMGN